MTRMAYAAALLDAEARACAFCGSVPSIRWTGREYVAECPEHPDKGTVARGGRNDD